MKAIAIGFHDVVDDLSSAQPIAEGHGVLYTIDRLHFRAHLQAIHDRAASSGAVLLTFDDGAISSYTHAAPELEAFGWRGLFFITTDWIGRPGFMSAAQIRELQARGHVIGSHSKTHPQRMSALSPAELSREWAVSCEDLSSITGTPVRTASVPGGFYSTAVARAAAREGVATLFTSEPTTARALVDGCMVLGRYAVRRSTSSAEVGALAAGAFGPRFKQAARWFAAKAAKRITGKSYFAIRRVLLARVAGS